MRPLLMLILFLSATLYAEAALTIDLKFGSRHVSVTELQTFLIQQKILTGEPTGYYGKATVEAVKTFQKREGLTPTGTVGPLTRTRIQSLSTYVQPVQPALHTQRKAATPSTPCTMLPLKVLERATVDRPDEVVGHAVHVMYVLPRDGVDESHDSSGAITHSVNAFAQWLCAQTKGSGLKLDTYQGGLDVTFVRLSASDQTLMRGTELPWKVNPDANPYIRDDIERRIKALGFNDPKKIYAVYYGGTSNTSCGGGPWPPTLIGSVAAVYLKGGYLSQPNVPRCETNKLALKGGAPGYLDFSMAHEIFHTLGLAPRCGKNHTLSGHVSDSVKDIMYQGEKSWDYANLTIDVNNDDYYKAGISGCTDLSRSIFLAPGGTELPPGW
jgi:hypothetical protein